MMVKSIACMVFGCLLAPPLVAQTSARALDRAPDSRITDSAGFVSARRDVMYRSIGVRHLRAGDPEAAAESFRRAARYADKISQAAYAEMLWEENGMMRDRALAYAWMDLAAERGTTPLLAKREAYWEALTTEEQARAIEVGQALYAEYGDAVAQRRQEPQMRRAKNTGTGTRLGSYTGNLRVIPANELMGNIWSTTVQGAAGIDGSAYYANRYWVPEQHWQREEAEIERSLMPRVRVGDLESRPSDDEERARDD